MAQNDTRSLVLDLVQELEGLKTSEELLNIALEQLNREDSKTIARLVLLAELAVSHLNCSIDEIGSSLKKLRQTSAFKQSDKM
jgi:ABC-type transporter Mla MlaB component